MSASWTCPSCQFEWVVPVGGECLSCGYTSTQLGTEPTARPQSFERPVEQPASLPLEDAMAALYPPGHYPPPVETPPMVNGPLAGTTPAEQERQMVQTAKAHQQQATFLKIMETARQRIVALEQEVATAAAAESEARASLEQWQQEAMRRAQMVQGVEQREQQQRQELIQLAEANQQLRQEQTQWRARVQETPRPMGSSSSQRPPATSFQAEARRVDRLEQNQHLLTQQMGQLSALLDTILGRLDALVPTNEVPAGEDAYATWITTDAQAARVEEEILRNQAQYNQPWRG